jgi:hypothetical protein
MGGEFSSQNQQLPWATIDTFFTKKLPIWLLLGEAYLALANIGASVRRGISQKSDSRHFAWNCGANRGTNARIRRKLFWKWENAYRFRSFLAFK